MSLIDEKLTEKVIGAAIEVHRHLGPGLLESAYESCLCYELIRRDLSFERQKHLAIDYKEIQIDCGYRLDIVIDDRVIVETKSVTAIGPIHEAQILTYLKLSRIRIGLLINFNELILKNGIRRFVL